MDKVNCLKFELFSCCVFLKKNNLKFSCQDSQSELELFDFKFRFDRLSNFEIQTFKLFNVARTHIRLDVFSKPLF